MQPNFFYELTLRRKYIAYNKLNNPKNNITSQLKFKGVSGTPGTIGVVSGIYPVPPILVSSDIIPPFIVLAIVLTLPLATCNGAVEYTFFLDIVCLYGLVE